MPLKAVAFTLACALVSTNAIAGDIASTSLCGDGYVLAMAPDQVSALSWQSRDALSLAPDEMRALPQAWPDLERLIALNPDIVVFGPGEQQKFETHLESVGIQSLEIRWGEDVETVIANLDDLVEAVYPKTLGYRNNFTFRISQLYARAKQREKSPRILYLSRSGGTAGSGTFVDEAITIAGGINVIKKSGWYTPDPEDIISYNPDLIITSYFTDGYESIQAVGIRHKVLSDFITAHPNIDIPGALWPCAGPGLIEAAERIADALDALP